VRYDVRSVLSRSEAPYRTLLPGVGRPALHGQSETSLHRSQGPVPSGPNNVPGRTRRPRCRSSCVSSRTRPPARACSAE
jgi:hypothetical protein